MTAPDASWKTSARAAYRAAGGSSPNALTAALDAAEADLTARGVIIDTGDPERDARAAARRLAEASDNNLFTGTPDGWTALLTERRRVWHAYNDAVNRRANEPDRTRIDLIHDRELLLAFIAQNARNP